MNFIKRILSSLISAARGGARQRRRLAVCALAVAAAAASLTYFQPRRAQAQQTPTTLRGAAALEQLKQDGQYESLQAAMNQARFSVSRAENTPLGRAAWRAPNPAAGYDAYVTEAGVSIAVDDKTFVSLSLHSFGYGHAMQGVAPGKVSGDKQTINVAREGGVREWYVNGPEGLEHGFTLSEPPGARHPGVPLRLVLQVSKGWRAVASEDGKAVTLRGADTAVEYGKLVVNDSQGRNIPARLAVDEEQVVIEVEDHDAAYPLTIDPIFTLQQKLMAADGAASDRFGDAVALSGDTVAVGAPYDNIGWNQDQGSVYIFTRSGATWTFQQKLTANDGAANDYFGSAVALDGDTVAVGAYWDDISPNANQGSVYVFTRSGEKWTFQQKLTANDGAADDYFGKAVALSGDTVVAGAYGDDIDKNTYQGSAYVFTRSGSVWTQQKKLTDDDGATDDAFGWTVALEGDTAVIGSPWGDGAIADQGAAYVFIGSGSVWTMKQKLTANDGAQKSFGISVAISGDTVAVGASNDKVGSNVNQGSAYVFKRSGTWTQQQKLTAFDGAAGDLFGHAVALYGDIVAVGAVKDNIGANSTQGSAYVFARSGATWTHQQKLTAFDGAADDRFGAALALGKGTVVAGVGRDDVNTNIDQGSVYVFAVTATPPPCSTLTIEPPTLPDDAPGAPYSETLTATGGREPYTFAVKGKLPPGLSLSADGVLSGTPTQEGDFSFTVVVSDAKGCAGSQSYSITIKDANSKTGAPRRSSALPSLTGEEAVARLKEEGLYSSLTDAMRAARPESSSAAVQAINLPFAQLFRQTARDGAANDSYGYSVAASDDTVVVGAYLDTVGVNARQGSVYVFSRSGDDWTLQQKLVANDGEAEERFGNSVAISGHTIVVGAPYDKTGTNYYHGSAYVFVRSGGVWSFQKKLAAHDGAAYDQFGYSVGISGNTVVAGAFSDDNGAKKDQGSAYVFVRSNGVWLFQQKLTANDGEANDQFGVSVAISGGTVIAGAPLDDLDIAKDAGSAYVFVRAGTVWAQQQKLSGLISVGSTTSDLFGVAVAVSGDTALIGVPGFYTFGRVSQGLAAVFVRSGGVWSYQGPLAANDGEAGDRFGISVALNGDTALIGAYFDDIGASAGVNPDQGSAYLFTRSGALWGARQKFTAQGGAAREMFGQTVALSGDRAIVGAPHAKIGANLSQGAVYIFGCGHAEQPKLTGLGSEAGDSFGSAVAIDGNTAVVGVKNDDVGTKSSQGSAYVFVRNGAGWTQMAQLFAYDGAADDRFGHSVAISGETIVIGAPWKTMQGYKETGAAYVYIRSGNAWVLQERLFGKLVTMGWFGYSVSISGDRLAVSAPFDDVGANKSQGSVTIYRRPGTTWLQEKVVTANDGGDFDYFGWSVALSGDKLLVGAPGGDSDLERSKGAAYIFERSSTQPPTWVQRAKLVAGDSQILDHLGHSVALSGNTALASAPGKVNNNPLRRQAAYVFAASSASGGTWSQQARLILGEGYQFVPVSVALSGDTAIVGTSGETIEGRFIQGAAYVFTRSGAVWTPQQYIVASDGRDHDVFGASVGISGDTVMVGAPQAGSVRQGVVYVLKKSCGSSLARLASVSAASFDEDGGLAPESITALFGVNLADETQASSSLPLPTTLAGVSLKVTDSAGMERLAPLFFVSPGQINYVIPAGTANGSATLKVMNAGEPVASGEARIASAAPGLFSANASGEGVAAALALRIKADGSQSYEPVAQFDLTQNRFVPTPIDLGPGADQVFLVFYGTGLRYRSSLSAVSCAIGGVESESLFAGPAPGFAGLDQVNVRLPRSLAGRGEVDVELLVDGEAANPVRVDIR